MLSISGAPRAATALAETEMSTFLTDKCRNQKQKSLLHEQTAVMGRYLNPQGAKLDAASC